MIIQIVEINKILSKDYKIAIHITKNLDNHNQIYTL